MIIIASVMSQESVNRLRVLSIFRVSLISSFSRAAANTEQYYTMSSQNAPFCICNNFVKPSSLSIIFARVYLNKVSVTCMIAYFRFFINQKTEYQLEICFCLLFSRRTAMVYNEAKILIKNLYLFKNYSATKLITEFPEKSWKQNFKLFFEEVAWIWLHWSKTWEWHAADDHWRCDWRVACWAEGVCSSQRRALWTSFVA